MSEAVPQVLDYWLLEEGDSLAVVVVLENLEKERHELSHVVVHHLTALWNELLSKNHSMRVDQNNEGKLSPFVSGEGLRDVEGHGKQLALLFQWPVPDLLVLLLRQSVFLEVAPEKPQQRFPENVSLELFVRG